MKSIVIIRKYDPMWAHKFETERKYLRETFGEAPCVIEHIGSTAVPGLSAKPIIDIALGFESPEMIGRCVGFVERIGYEHLPSMKKVISDCLYFHKGQPPLRDFHLFAVLFGSNLWLDWIAFRNILRISPTLRRKYEMLKRSLAERFPADRHSYTAAKFEFVSSVISTTERA